ncbi:MAG: hypothetical protein U5K54_10460 [Cytophagales bacterium]|nr:hypothetical protein [Cytophagales bacterium]
MQKKKVANDDEIKKIYRLAHQKDLEKFEEIKKRDLPHFTVTPRNYYGSINLITKLSDVEFQAIIPRLPSSISAEDRVRFPVS